MDIPDNDLIPSRELDINDFFDSVGIPVVIFDEEPEDVKDKPIREE